MIKVLKIAFGHPDNVLSLCSNLSKEVDLTLLFVVSGDRFQQGIFDIDLRDKPCGLYADDEVFGKTFPKPIVDFVGGQYRVWLLKVNSRKLQDLRNLRIYWSAANKLKQERFDVVHYNGFSPYIYLFYQRFGARPQQFWTLHDYVNHTGEKNTRAEKINQILARLNRLTVIQHYEYLREKVIETFNLPSRKVQTLLSGPLDVFHTFQAKDTLCPPKDYILFFGRVSPYKGVDVLLEAYAKIPEPKPQLVIAGKGQLWFDAAPYEADPNIHLINKYIENEELIGLIQGAQFVVVPYRDATHSAVIATAYAMSKPVVASDVDGLKEVVFDQVTGRLVQPGSSKSLQAVLEDLIQHPEALSAFEQNIEREKESGKIAWGTIIREYVALYSGQQLSL